MEAIPFPAAFWEDCELDFEYLGHHVGREKALSGECFQGWPCLKTVCVCVLLGGVAFFLTGKARRKHNFGGWLNPKDANHVFLDKPSFC